MPAAWVTADEAYGQDPSFRGLAGAAPDRLRRWPPRNDDLLSARDGHRRRAERPGRARRAAAEGVEAAQLRRRAPRATASTTGPPSLLDTDRAARRVGALAAGPPLRLTPRRGEPNWPTTCAPAPPRHRCEELIRVAGARWAVEECFQTAKNETGLDQYQVRRYDAWYATSPWPCSRHAYLAVTRATTADASTGTAEKGDPRLATPA